MEGGSKDTRQITHFFFSPKKRHDPGSLIDHTHVTKINSSQLYITVAKCHNCLFFLSLSISLSLWATFSKFAHFVTNTWVTSPDTKCAPRLPMCFYWKTLLQPLPLLLSVPFFFLPQLVLLATVFLIPTNYGDKCTRVAPLIQSSSPGPFFGLPVYFSDYCFKFYCQISSG